MPKQIGYMSQTQFNKYIEKYNETKLDETNYQSLEKDNKTNQYYKTPRKYSNMLYDFAEQLNLKEFSTKMPLLIQNLAENPNDKHYVYSAFYSRHGFGGQGINAIAKIIEKELGFTKLTIDDVKNGFDNLTKKKRYILATSTELNEEQSPTLARETLNNFIKMFNKTENVSGDYVSLFLASGKYNEAIDLTAVRFVHIFEPLLSQAMEKQTIGRAVRFCSHSDLNKIDNKWTVSIFRYYSDFPADLTLYNTYKLENQLKLTKLEYDNVNSSLSNPLILNNKKENASILSTNKEKLKTKMKTISDKIKKLQSMNLSNVQMIDNKISRESVMRANEMIKINNAIRETAVDCMLTKDFHKDISLTCTYEK